MLNGQETFLMLKAVIKKEGWIEIPSTGYSMFPFIQSGNVCRFSSCDPQALKKGDVILFCTHTGQLIAHRFYKSERVHNGTYYIFKGDTNLGCDEPVEADRIIGRLVTVYKKNKRVLPDALLPFLWGKIVFSFPLLSDLLRRYLNRRNYLQY